MDKKPTCIKCGCELRMKSACICETCMRERRRPDLESLLMANVKKNNLDRIIEAGTKAPRKVPRDSVKRDLLRKIGEREDRLGPKE